MISKQHIYPLCQSLFISRLIIYKILQAVLDTNLFKDLHMVDLPRVMIGIKLRFNLLLVSTVWAHVLPGMPHSPAVWHGVYSTSTSILFVLLLISIILLDFITPCIRDHSSTKVFLTHVPWLVGQRGDLEFLPQQGPWKGSIHYGYIVDNCTCHL